MSVYQLRSGGGTRSPRTRSDTGADTQQETNRDYVQLAVTSDSSDPMLEHPTEAQSEPSSEVLSLNPPAHHNSVARERAVALLAELKGTDIIVLEPDALKAHVRRTLQVRTYL
jgi:hypothetical protein